MLSRSLWLVALAISLWGRPALAAGCDPADHEHFICGVANSEDLVSIRGTGWVAASGMAVKGGGMASQNNQGHLYIIDSRTQAVTDIDFAALDKTLDKKTYPDCPGPPDAANFNTHGLWYRPGRNGPGRLYAVNHGGRESVEVFDVAATPQSVKLTWVGCGVVPGGHVFLDGVVGTPEGGFVVTSLFDPSAKSTTEQLDAGTVKGAIFEWRPEGAGFSPLPGGDLVTPNGIEISADGKTLYVAGWTSHSVVVLSRGATVSKQEIPTDFMPDNMRFADDGTLYAAGQAATVANACPDPSKHPTRCTGAWAAAKVDLKALKATDVIRRDVGSVFGSATTALPVGKDIWVGTFHGDRIARLTPEDVAAH